MSNQKINIEGSNVGNINQVNVENNAGVDKDFGKEVSGKQQTDDENKSAKAETNVTLKDLLKMKLTDLQDEWATLNELTKELRNALAIENDVVTKFKLEKQLEVKNREIDKIESDMKEIELALAE